MQPNLNEMNQVSTIQVLINRAKVSYSGRLFFMQVDSSECSEIISEQQKFLTKSFSSTEMKYKATVWISHFHANIQNLTLCCTHAFTKIANQMQNERMKWQRTNERRKKNYRECDVFFPSIVDMGFSSIEFASVSFPSFKYHFPFMCQPVSVKCVYVPFFPYSHSI